MLVKARIARMIEAEIAVAGPIAVTPGRGGWWPWWGRPAWARPPPSPSWPPTTGSSEKRSVGLITVDTYRIAAVEQLRTYADIIDLPMQVVSTPREMREAVRPMRTST